MSDSVGKLLPLILGGGVTALGMLFRHKASSGTPAHNTSSATKSNVARLVDNAVPPDPAPLQIPDSSGEVNRGIPIITGIQNTLNKYGPVPQLFGRYKMFPQLAGQLVSSAANNNTWAQALFILGYGPISATDFLIGETPITGFGANASMQFLPGALPYPSEQITISAPGTFTFQVNLPLLYNQTQYIGPVGTGTGLVQGLAVEIDFNGIYLVDSNGDHIQHEIDFNIDYILAGNNGIPITIPNNPPPPPGGTPLSIGAGANVVIPCPTTDFALVGQWVTITDSAHSELALITGVIGDTSITVAQLLNSYSGAVSNIVLTFQAWQRVEPPNGLATDPSISAVDNYSAGTSRSVSWQVGEGTYIIRITRLTPNVAGGSTPGDNASWANCTFFDSQPTVVPWIDQNGNNIPISLLALNLLATEGSLSGNLSSLSCLAQRELAQFNGADWNTVGVTSNPAWAFAEILTGPANPSPLLKSQLNGNALKAWADYCDEKGFEFNYIIDADTTVPQALADCATAGRATVHVGPDGLYAVIVDSPQTTPIQHITPRNVIKDTFKFKYTFPDQPHAIKARFVNEANNWQQDERIVYNDGYSIDGSDGTAIATRFEQLNLTGVTSADHAFRLARYRLAVAKLRQREWTVEMDLDNLACDRGDMVLLNYDVPLFGFGWGRVSQVVTDMSGDVTGIILDTQVTMDVGISYCVRIRQSDNSSFFGAVNTVAGTTQQLTLAMPIPADTETLPAVGDLAMFGELNEESIECIVQAIQYHADFTATLTLIDYAPGVFTSEDEPIPPFVSGVTSQPAAQISVEAPVIVSVESDDSVLVENSDGSLADQILISLAPAPIDVVAYETEYQLSDASSWTSMPLVPSTRTTISIVGVQAGSNYNFRIRSRNALNYTSTWVTVNQYMVIGKTTPPPDVLFLDRINNLLNWTYPNPPKDLAGFQLRFNIGVNPNFAAATVGAALIQGNQFDLTPLPTGTLTIMLVAVNTSGLLSANPAVLYDNVGEAPIGNVIGIPYANEPTWPANSQLQGNIINGTISGGILVANDSGGTFWNDDGITFWDTQDADLFWNSTYDALQYAFIFTPDASLGTSFNLSLDVDATGAPVTIEYLTFGNGLFWDQNDSDLFWGPDGFFYGAPNYAPQPWPGQINATLQQYAFSIFCGKRPGPVQGIIRQADVIVSVPDIDETINNFLSVGQQRLPITNIYRAIKNVQLTLNYDPVHYPTAAGVRTLDKDPTGPLVEVVDASGSPTTGSIDATVTGY